jgi:hypothetical protein
VEQDNPLAIDLECSLTGECSAAQIHIAGPSRQTATLKLPQSCGMMQTDMVGRMLLRGNAQRIVETKTARAARADLLVNLPQITGETGGELLLSCGTDELVQ